MSTELVDAETGEIVTGLIRPDSWSGATARAFEARKEREAIVKEILREGHDFGTVPGCGDKPALLKPGAEKIADALNLYPDYEEMDKVQDFANRVWFYRYRCRLRQRGSDIVMSTGIGSCNSEAAKYKYRDAQRACPHCGRPAIIKGREEYGGGWLCFVRKGGCGAKFIDRDPAIIEQQVGQVENPDIAALVNTVDKMAQKSAFVAACLNLGFSEQFTQDIEEMGHDVSGLHNTQNRAGAYVHSGREVNGEDGSERGMSGVDRQHESGTGIRGNPSSGSQEGVRASADVPDSKRTNPAGASDYAHMRQPAMHQTRASEGGNSEAESTGRRREGANASISAPISCPACGGPVWDNRETKKGNQPDFKCKSKSCNKAVWLPKEPITEGYSEDQVLRDQYFAQAEKIMIAGGMEESKRKDALGRLLMLSTEEMGTKVVELSGNAQKKSKPDAARKKEDERLLKIADIKRDADADKLDDYLTKNFPGLALEQLDFDAVSAVHDEFVIPF